MCFLQIDGHSKFTNKNSKNSIPNGKASVTKKNQPFILNSRWENHISFLVLRTNWRTDRHGELKSSFATKKMDFQEKIKENKLIVFS